MIVEKSVMQEKLFDLATNLIDFELNNFEKVTLTKKMSSGLIERLLAYHEREENYEMCQKILNYKNKMQDV